MTDLTTAATRLNAGGRSALVLKTRHAGQAGRQTMVRVLSGEFADGEAVKVRAAERFELIRGVI